MTGSQEVHDQVSHLTLLADLTNALVSTLDVEEATARLVRLLVPRFGDWASVILLDDMQQLHHAVARHVEPDRAGDIEWFSRLDMRTPPERSLLRRVARTGESILQERLAPEDVVQGWQSEELLAVLKRIGVGTLMAVPLRGRVHTLGVLVLSGGEQRAPYTDADLATATDIGQRAGLALENAQLFARQRTTAETLQRHLLPNLPEPDHLQIVPRYRPAREEAQVGGDFYWGALQPDGAMILAIGDVSGHDLTATSWQAQLAPMLRGFAFEETSGPASTLRRVDAAMRGLQIDTMATVVLARIERTSADAALLPAGGQRLRWSNAGHPPPVILQADGQVVSLETEPDLLLGLDPHTERHDHETVIGPGDTLLLYTDGLVERRDSPLEIGLIRLRQVLGSLARLPLEELCDALIARLVSEEADDDVALLAVRARPGPVAAATATPAAAAAAAAAATPPARTGAGHDAD